MKAPIVSAEQWLIARQALLLKEKEFTHLRDELTRQRQQLPWTRVDKPYEFEGPQGKQTLAQLFGKHSQLVVYHFMFGPDWDAGCPSCSFWADNFNGIPPHLAHRDVAFTAISRAPWAKIDAYRARMGWGFDWVSSLDSDFNFDYGVSFTPQTRASGKAFYNFSERPNSMDELPGISVFAKDEHGNIFRTYSCYARGLDMMNACYQYLDLAPKGRDEAQLSNPQSWVRRHDEYA